jgi:hypothetical protein
VFVLGILKSHIVLIVLNIYFPFVKEATTVKYIVMEMLIQFFLVFKVVYHLKIIFYDANVLFIIYACKVRRKKISPNNYEKAFSSYSQLNVDLDFYILFMGVVQISKLFSTFLSRHLLFSLF